MKHSRYITIFLLATLSVFSVAAQNRITVAGDNLRDKIEILDPVISQDGDNVVVTFNIAAARGAVRGKRTLYLQPVITNGIHQVSTPGVVVKGRGADVAAIRRQWAAGHPSTSGQRFELRNGRKVSYRAAVPAQRWMHGAEIKLEGLDTGCCNAETLTPVVLASNIALPMFTQPLVAETPPEPAKPVTTGILIAETYSFVVPYSEYDEDDPFKIYDDDRDNALIVYYRQGKSVIDRAYMENNTALNNLLTAINKLLASRDSEIRRIVVAGFASPEGSFATNDRLAFERAISVKEYIMLGTGIAADRILVHNGSVDWRGLRRMVSESDMADREQIIRIIDTVPIWDAEKNVGRLGTLMRLNGGKPYRYMYQHFFPLLRSGAFVKVYFEDR